MYEPKLIKFYVHNYAILYSEIFYIRFFFSHDFSCDFTIFVRKNSGTILWFYNHILRSEFRKAFPCRVKIVIFTTLIPTLLLFCMGVGVFFCKIVKIEILTRIGRDFEKSDRKIVPEFFRTKIVKSQLKSCEKQNRKIVCKIFLNTK